MRLSQEDFLSHVEKLKEADKTETQLDMWLNHGLPVYTNYDELIKLLDVSDEI
mgnify:FL=1|tara:strand:+ start:239 stop:397 length:159 start_codon:yes stop_codon:yes gene_type:complete